MTSSDKYMKLAKQQELEKQNKKKHKTKKKSNHKKKLNKNESEEDDDNDEMHAEKSKHVVSVVVEMPEVGVLGLYALKC